MFTINARNVNDAYYRTMTLIEAYGNLQKSRMGDVKVLPEPLSIRYAIPQERVLFDPERDANPFFHLMEALWMLAGRNDVGWLSYYLPRMADFSDDGLVFRGAYGHRWRRWFGIDQLKILIRHLERDHNSRRAVLQMWDCTADLDQQSKDIPCNIMAKFEIVDGNLNMVVFNRSNDLILGALGANVVHFSVLQEFIANALQVQVGWYEQVTANAHVYIEEWKRRKLPGSLKNVYAFDHTYVPYPGCYQPSIGGMLSGTTWQKFLGEELSLFMLNPLSDQFESNYLAEVASPIAAAFRHYKRRDWGSAFIELGECQAPDWKQAATHWLTRRQAKAEANHGTV